MAPQPSITPEQAQKAASAYTAILAAGKRPSVRALASEAGIATEAARQWLATSRPAPVAVAMPDEVAAAVTGAARELIWPAALTAARESVSEDDAAEIQAIRDAEAESASQVEKLTAELLDARLELERLSADLVTAREEAASAETRIAEHRRDTEAAKAAQLRAETTVEVLQGVVAGFQEGPRRPANYADGIDVS